MTFLELVNSARSECGIAGNDLTSLSNVSSRELARLIKWVRQSYVEIQQITDWKFLRKSFSFSTLAGKQSYTPAECGVTSLGRWIDGSIRYYLTSDGAAAEQYASHVDYEDFRAYYQFGPRRTQQGIPSVVAVSPDRSLLLADIPDNVYTVSGEYYAAPQSLAANTDTPLMPSHFHMLIVYRTMIKYGMYESAQEQVTSGQNQYNEMLNRLRVDQGPSIGMGASFI